MAGGADESAYTLDKWFATPMSYDDYLGRDPETCVEEFKTLAKGFGDRLWWTKFWKIVLLFWFGVGLVSPTIGPGYFSATFDEMDANYKCAYGQPGFSEKNFNDDWWWQKSYLKRIAINLSENTTFFYQMETLDHLMAVFAEMADV